MFWGRPFAPALLFAAVSAGAFDFQYGDVLRVSAVTRAQNALRLPLTRGKYANIRVLTRPVYEFLLSCAEPCRLERAETGFSVAEFRAAKSRPGMWIADVDFNGELEVTFLVFKNKSGFLVKTPEPVAFMDRALQKRVYTALQTRAEEMP